LGAEGISAELLDEATGSIDWGLMPALGGLRLKVAPADLARAREILGGQQPTPSEVDIPVEIAVTHENEVQYFEKAKRRKRLVGAVALLLLFGPAMLFLLIEHLQNRRPAMECRDSAGELVVASDDIHFAGDQGIQRPESVSRAPLKVEGKVLPPDELVVIEVVVDSSGATCAARHVRGEDTPTNAMWLEVVKQWRYSPATLHGKPVPVREYVSLAPHPQDPDSVLVVVPTRKEPVWQPL
jgi:hypothetical protein